MPCTAPRNKQLMGSITERGIFERVFRDELSLPGINRASRCRSKGKVLRHGACALKGLSKQNGMLKKLQNLVCPER